MQTGAGLNGDWMAGTHAKDTDRTVVQGGPKRGRRPFNVTAIVI